MADAVEIALNAVWSREEARFQGAQLAALDAAVRGIATELSVHRVLQLIVDRVRELVAGSVRGARDRRTLRQDRAVHHQRALRRDAAADRPAPARPRPARADHP